MRFAALLLLATLVTPTVAAQNSRLGPPEKRPKLQAGADTNDASSYFQHATRTLEDKPNEAAAAFYWAARLDPGSAEALDGRRASLIMRKRATLKAYMEGGRRVQNSKEFLALDSLVMRALRLDPLYYRKYDHAMLMAYYREDLRREYPNASIAEIDEAVRDYLNSGSAYMRGWMAYGEGRLPAALDAYEQAIKQSRNPGALRLERARIMALQGRFPAAVLEFRAAGELLAKREGDREENVVFYNSRAMLEHSLAIAYSRDAKLDSARAALGRAITEDLSYFMAHVELGRLALAAKDTATAVSELALAADLAVDEPWVHYLHGSTLLSAGQAADAIAPFKKAIELEPFHASSHFELGMALERTGDKAGAKASFERYLAIAPRRESVRRATATQRIAALAP
jgi:tetratricopeptide (TPR) repeat protein